MTKNKKQKNKPNKRKEKKFKITLKNSNLPEEEKRKRLFEVFDTLLSKQDLSKHADSKKRKRRVGNISNKKSVEEAARRLAEILIKELEWRKKNK